MTMKRIWLLGLTFLFFSGSGARADFPQRDAILSTLKANSYFNVTGSEIIDLGGFGGSGTKNPQINLVLIVENGSIWTNAGVLSGELNKNSGIFSQCSIALGEVLEVTIDIPSKTDQILKTADPYHPPELLIAQKGLPTSVPLGILLKKRASGMALAYNQNAVEIAAQEGQDVSQLQNTFWMTDNYIPYQVTPHALPGFSMMAHEIAHLIGNLEHLYSGPANLMQVSNLPSSINGDLNADQCGAILAYSWHNSVASR